MLTLLSKAFPPAKVIFTGIGVLLGVRTLALAYRRHLSSNAGIF